MNWRRADTPGRELVAYHQASWRLEVRKQTDHILPWRWELRSYLRPTTGNILHKNANIGKVT